MSSSEPTPTENILVLASTNQAFAKDPGMALRDAIKNHYTIEDPAWANVRFDTKFDNLSIPYQIIIFPLRITVAKEEVGGGRKRYEDRRKIHIYATGHSALDKAEKMKEHVDDIINANPHILRNDGIGYVEIEDFVQVRSYNPADANRDKAEEILNLQWVGTALMVYDKVRVPYPEEES